MKVEHCGIEVEYHEKDNLWKCEIRGRARSFDSLAKAKAGIEAEPKGKDGKVEKMEPIPVFMDGGYRSSVTKGGKITSFASGKEAWCVFSGARSKEWLSNVYLDTPESRKVFEEATALDLEASKLRDKAQELRKSINPKPPTI